MGFAVQGDFRADEIGARGEAPLHESVAQERDARPPGRSLVRREHPALAGLDTDEREEVRGHVVTADALGKIAFRRGSSPRIGTRRRSRTSRYLRRQIEEVSRRDPQLLLRAPRSDFPHQHQPREVGEGVGLKRSVSRRLKTVMFDAKPMASVAADEDEEPGAPRQTSQARLKITGERLQNEGHGVDLRRSLRRFPREGR